MATGTTWPTSRSTAGTPVATCGGPPRSGARPPGTLLEIGSAAGFLLDKARDVGWNVRGVEISDLMRAASADRDLPVAGAIDELDLTPGWVNLVVLNQVLEHVVNPVAMLDRTASLLRTGGVVSIETWDR